MKWTQSTSTIWYSDKGYAVQFFTSRGFCAYFRKKEGEGYRRIHNWQEGSRVLQDAESLCEEHYKMIQYEETLINDVQHVEGPVQHVEGPIQ